MQKLTKLQSSHNNLRTDEIIGEAIVSPTIGKSFVFIGEVLTEAYDPWLDTTFFVRMITTSTVTEVVESNGVIEFKTLNSIYKLETLQGSLYGS